MGCEGDRVPLLKHKALTIHSWITFSLEIVVAVGEAEVKELGCHAERRVCTRLLTQNANKLFKSKEAREAWGSIVQG